MYMKFEGKRRKDCGGKRHLFFLFCKLHEPWLSIESEVYPNLAPVAHITRGLRFPIIRQATLMLFGLGKSDKDMNQKHTHGSSSDCVNLNFWTMGPSVRPTLVISQPWSM